MFIPGEIFARTILSGSGEAQAKSRIHEAVGGDFANRRAPSNDFVHLGRASPSPLQKSCDVCASDVSEVRAETESTGARAVGPKLDERHFKVLLGGRLRSAHRRRQRLRPCAEGRGAQGGEPHDRADSDSNSPEALAVDPNLSARITTLDESNRRPPALYRPARVLRLKLSMATASSSTTPRAVSW